ncbi:MAG: M20/M25/M40 family metallo-hydrolase [Candidatus Korobacteraceae bacterium]
MAQRRLCVSLAFLFACTLPILAADKSKPASASEPSYDQPQPEREALDLNMYQRIRIEGLNHSHAMEYASALFDDIGPRLTGSQNLKHANEWTRDQFTAMGCANAHLEDWGEFGMGWQQLNTWVRMASPDPAVFIAQAVPWSPATNGAVTGQAIWMDIKDEKDLDKFKGKLTGKIVLYGPMRDVPPVEKPLWIRYDDKELEKLTEWPLKPRDRGDFLQQYMKRLELRQKVGKFLADEHALAVVTPSRDGRDGGGSGGTIFDDSNAAFNWEAYKREKANPLPVVVMAIENYGRVYRLLKANVPVSIEMNVDTKFTGDHEHGYDTIAEIPGTDPKLKDEVVMVGSHLDSWASGTGATDNGAGTVVTLEVMRILTTLGVKPRRTIRAALWTGEEQGEYGSYGYVKQHFGYVPLSTAPDQVKLPEWVRKPGGPIQLKQPEYEKISGYFNVDNGSGKIRGIYLQENAAMAPIFAQWIAPLKDLGVTTITLRNTGGTDHEAFDSIGIPGFQFIQDPLDYSSRTHHSNMDVYEELSPEDLAQAAVVEATFVYNTAMRDQMLPRKPMPHPELEDQLKAPLKNIMPGAQAVEKETNEKADQTPQN